jgi:ABC-type dipeptide/oligopeptide/nickel transport system permease component
MARYSLRRLSFMLLQLLLLAVLVFFTIRLMPADPAARLVGMNASPEAYAQARASLGLERPLLEQFTDFLGVTAGQPGGGILQGSLGLSWESSEPVIEELARSLPVTLEIVTTALLLSLLLALPLGAWAAVQPGGVLDRFAYFWGMFAGSQPDYWWGLLFLLVFAFTLGIAPAPLGRYDPLLLPPEELTGFIFLDSVLAGRWDVLRSALAYLALPVLTMVFTISGAIVKMVRQNTLRALDSDYVLFARACGLPEQQVAGYALRSAMAPTLTLLAVFFSILLSAAVTVERVFSLNGIGQYAVRAILNVDYPAIQGAVLAVALVSLLVYLAVDLAHAAIDPRARGR